MAKKILAATLATMLALALVIVPSAKGALVIDLIGALEEYADSGEADANDYLLNAGGGARAWENGGLVLYDRGNDYDSVDLKAGNFADGTYVVEVTFASTAPAKYKIGNGSGPYGDIKSVENSTSATLEVELAVADGKWQTALADSGQASKQERIRFQTEDTNEFYIMGLKVYEAGGDAVVEANDDAGAGNDGAADAASGAGDTATATPEKGSPNSGIGDVAVASAIAIVAAGAVVFSRKKK